MIGEAGIAFLLYAVLLWLKPPSLTDVAIAALTGGICLVLSIFLSDRPKWRR